MRTVAGVRDEMVAPGAVLAGRYRLHESIGAGGVARVFRGRDLRLRRDVAIKVLDVDRITDPNRRLRMQLEAVAAASLAHPNVVTVYDAGLAEGPSRVPFIVMELVDGVSLREVLTLRGSLPSREVLGVVLSVCSALTHAHEHAVLHRDIKPENVLVSRDGMVKIADFGMARILDHASLTPNGIAVGTLAYLAPELLAGEQATPASEQYAVGALCATLLTGRRMAVDPQTGQRVPHTASAEHLLPPAVSEVVERATHPAPRERFSDLSEFVAAFAAAVPEGPEPVHLGGERGTTTATLPVVVRAQTTPLAPTASPGTAIGRRSERRPPPRTLSRFSKGAIATAVAVATAISWLALGGGSGSDGGSPRNEQQVPRITSPQPLVPNPGGGDRAETRAPGPEIDRVDSADPPAAPEPADPEQGAELGTPSPTTAAGEPRASQEPAERQPPRGLQARDGGQSGPPGRSSSPPSDAPGNGPRGQGRPDASQPGKPSSSEPVDALEAPTLPDQ